MTRTFPSTAGVIAWHDLEGHVSPRIDPTRPTEYERNVRRASTLFGLTVSSSSPAIPPSAPRSTGPSQRLESSTAGTNMNTPKATTSNPATCYCSWPARTSET